MAIIGVFIGVYIAVHIITTAATTTIGTTAAITTIGTTTTITVIGTLAITTIIASTVVTIIVIGRGDLSGLAPDQISYALGQRPQHTHAVAFPFSKPPPFWKPWCEPPRCSHQRASREQRGGSAALRKASSLAKGLPGVADPYIKTATNVESGGPEMSWLLDRVLTSCQRLRSEVDGPLAKVTLDSAAAVFGVRTTLSF